MRIVTRILLVAKSGHARALEVAGRICARLENLAVQASVVLADDVAALSQFCAEKPAAEEEKLILVLGGDGTLVGVVRHLLAAGCRSCPVLGINFGSVGFLVEIRGDDWVELLSPLVRGELPAHRRLALAWELLRGGELLDSGFAVNDIVVARRSALARVCRLHVAVDGWDLGQIRADGLIVSTPAGTSGYAYSAGASLVHPDVQALSLTAISPFLSHFPNITLPPEKIIDVTVEPFAADGYLTVDGQDGFDMAPGDTVRVRGVPDAFRMIVPDSAAYFYRLRECGFTLEPACSPRNP